MVEEKKKNIVGTPRGGDEFEEDSRSSGGQDAPRVDKFLEYIGKNVGKRELYSIVSRILRYESTPPEIDEFISDPAYLGSVLDGGRAVYEYWRSALRAIYPNPFQSPYLEVVATGAIGIGKTTLAKIGSSYDIAKMTMLANPQVVYGIVEREKIQYAIINATMSLAKSVIYDELISWWNASPYFSNLMKKNKSSDTLFPKRIHLTVGSRPQHFIGKHIFGAIMDEMNFQDRVANQAYDNYTNVLRRMKSRFGNVSGGFFPGHLWLLSSKRRDTDPLQEHIERSKNDPTTIIFDAALWEVKRERLSLSGKYFYVYAGDGSRDPFILGEKYDHRLHFHLDDSRIVRVPIEFREDFEKDIFNALRDLAGVSVQGVHKFIPSVEAVDSVMTGKNITDREVLEIDFNDKESLMSYLLPNISKIKEPMFPNRHRYIHIDLALTRDYAAIASSYIMDHIEVYREDPSTGVTSLYREPIHFVEWVIYIKPKPNQEIPIYKIRDFVVELYKSKFPIRVVSADGYQSALLLQDLKLAGVKTDVVSVDRSYDPYLNLKRAIYERRIVLPRISRLKEELLNLIDTGRKIDHPVHGSKDGADAVAGSVWLATLDQSSGAPRNPLHSLSSLTEEDLYRISLGL